MKMFKIMYFVLSINSFMLVILFMNMYISQITSVPMNQIINIILFMILSSFISFMKKDYMTIYIFMILIVMVSGMMILFSYFVCMVNMINMKKFKFKYIYLLNYLLINTLMILSTVYNYNIMMKNFEIENLSLDKLIIKLFNFPNYYMLLIIISFMLLMLLMSSKICFSSKKPLRNKLF
uniref:NADH dehydrogenase subunit 6 n=1 Tax=Tetragonula iridipennis TaxID=597212 RepID=UPI0026E3CEFB|nr:NADH dehydrogenase subunit 6 [Tetragonula iridipennis]WJQ22763.1 NADH dehydrogenase subunit 6 [Tetragonula iridipennis]